MSQTGKERSALWDYMVRSGLMNVREHTHKCTEANKHVVLYIYMCVCVFVFPYV